MDPLNIVCAADERFAMPLAITLRSAAIHCALPVRAFVLNTALSGQTRKNIELACARGTKTPQIIWVNVDRDYLAEMPANLKHLSQATYLRLAMGRLLPAEVTRAIYLDSDVLVVSDLAEMWSVPLHGNIVGASRDFLTPLAGQSNALAYCLSETGIPPTQPMFNAGILLLNLAAYRAEDMEKKCVDFLLRWRHDVKSADQDAINAVLFGRIKRLDFKWNVQVGGWENFKHSPDLSEQERNAVREVKPAILHFSGAGKPWNSGLRSPLCTDYVQKVGESGWYGAVGFHLWKAKRTAVCIRTGLTNKYNAMTAGQARPS